MSEEFAVADHDGIRKCVPKLCPHRGAPLQDGYVVEDVLVCSWHRSVFSLLDGHAVSGPATQGIELSLMPEER